MGRALDLRDRDYFQRASAIQDGTVVQIAVVRLTGAAMLQIASPIRGTIIAY